MNQALYTVVVKKEPYTQFVLHRVGYAKPLCTSTVAYVDQLLHAILYTPSRWSVLMQVRLLVVPAARSCGQTQDFYLEHREITEKIRSGIR